MMKYLFNNVGWKEIDYIGFDMDGTLYDEFDFVVQPYSEISKLLSNDSLNFMKNRWLEKGSSYPFIFDEAFDKFGKDTLIEKSEFINQSLEIYRNYQPKLKLSNRIETILSYCKKNYKIFLITDGNAILQRKKFQALGLNKYFESDTSIFTGDFSKQYHKPNIGALKILNIEPSKSIFFGDRINDEGFAKNSGMRFQKVYNMIKI